MGDIVFSAMDGKRCCHKTVSSQHREAERAYICRCTCVLPHVAIGVAAEICRDKGW